MDMAANTAGRNSMPSSHAANWFAATMIAFLFYRRSLWFMLPMALAVSFSRVYNGVHYPSDVLAGAILGAGYAAALASLHWKPPGNGSEENGFRSGTRKCRRLLNAECGMRNAESKIKVRQLRTPNSELRNGMAPPRLHSDFCHADRALDLPRQRHHRA